ncbi:MAG: TonB family protein [Spirochaetaceae bacterium]|jgi:protein TonB|nr:TonB family protein [Spirochaetaceae bacterium]
MKNHALFPVVLCASVFFHAGFFFLLAVEIPGASDPRGRDTPERAFSLVNIALIEPAAPEPPPSRPEPILLPEAPSPEPLPVPDNAPAENYIITTEEETAAADREAQDPAPPVQAESAGPGGRAAESSGRTAEAAALTAEYVKRNYNYIQRRIRDRLVYPSPARRAGIQGVTEVSFIIHEDGRVSAVTVRAGSGHAVLDEAAVATILAAAPFPAPPAAARIAIPISFRLR